MDTFEEKARQRAMNQAIDAENNLLKARSKWDSERALHDKLDRIEEMLKKLLNEKV